MEKKVNFYTKDDERQKFRERKIEELGYPIRDGSEHNLQAERVGGAVPGNSFFLWGNLDIFLLNQKG